MIHPCTNDARSNYITTASIPSVNPKDWSIVSVSEAYLIKFTSEAALLAAGLPSYKGKPYTVFLV